MFKISVASIGFNVSKSESVRDSIRLMRKFTTDKPPWIQPTGYNTGIQIYNCIERRNVPLILPQQHIATWYTCGPTVYDSTHLGHASCYVKLDIIQRILQKIFGIQLLTAMNITDIDDKIIDRSLKSGKTFQEIAKKYEDEFWMDLKKLNVQEPDIKIRVTDNMPEIIDFIKVLTKKGDAYVGNDNSVYFRVETYSGYGKLQKLSLESKEDELKMSNIDFALWKSQKLSSEPFWPSPWSNGRPGWHIECSALASKIFGNSIDFHAGGLDLKFPHHENEETQSCAFHNRNQWVNYWMHTGQLSVKGEQEKMSKSLKNTISVDEMLHNYSGDDFRMACILSNYRNSMEYSDEMMETGKNTLNKFKAFRSDCQAYLEGKKRSNGINSNQVFDKLSATMKNIDKSLKDDFNTAKCVKNLSDLVGFLSKMLNVASPAVEITNYSASDVQSVGAVDKYIQNILEAFGLQYSENLDVGLSSNFDSNSLVEEIVALRKSIRNKAVATKNQELFEICDDIRNTLRIKGIEIKDHSKGCSWNIIK